MNFEDKQISDAQYEMRINIQSDGSKSKARDPYIILSVVPNKNEVEVQKLLDRNRRNLIRVNLQNI